MAMGERDDGNAYLNAFLKRSIAACPRAGVDADTVVRSKLRTRLLVLERAGRDATPSRIVDPSKRADARRPDLLRNRRSSRVRPGRGAAAPFARGAAAAPSPPRRFARYAPLHALWERSTFGAVAASNANAQQMRAALRANPDLTGAFLLVVRSAQPALVGCRGIVVQEFAAALRFVPPRNALRTVAKRGSTFAVQYGDVRVLLRGGDLVGR